jgi:biofilm PGA synthesis N-glycosyltransferase PgaC
LAAVSTPARNEENFIEKTLQSVVKQTVLPVQWVIVNDGSTDATGSIDSRCAEKYDWMELVNLLKRKGRNFAAKVHAFHAGKQRLKVTYKVIGNLDANVSLDDFIEQGYNSAIVFGQRQMFRRQCFEEIGGYFPSKNGGIDRIAVTTARMIGWKTRSYREKSFFHHRVLGTADRGILGSSYAYGKKDYYPGDILCGNSSGAVAG